MEPLHQQYLKDMIQSSFAKIRHKIEQMFTIYLQNLEKLEHTPAAKEDIFINKFWYWIKNERKNTYVLMF